MISSKSHHMAKEKALLLTHLTNNNKYPTTGGSQNAETVVDNFVNSCSFDLDKYPRKNWEQLTPEVWHCVTRLFTFRGLNQQLSDKLDDSGMNVSKIKTKFGEKNPNVSEAK